MHTTSKIIIATFSALLIQGCAVNKDMVPTGGSRADGTIELSYELAEMEIPKIDEGKALTSAVERCKAWGYTGAEKFGGSTKTCNAPAGFGGCSQWLVTTKYQCTGPSKN